MISLTIWVCLWSSFFVLAPPLLNINHSQSLENFTPITSHLSNTNSKPLIGRRKIKTNRTKIKINSHQFDIHSYRSSWKFIDKHTIRVRFRLYENLLNSIVSKRFLVHHLHSGHIQIFNQSHEIINSTLSLYLHNIKHGRHIVCLLLYRSKLTIDPKYIFCQDIVFNFHKYGTHDIDSDDHGNTFVFLLTQYSIVIGILCILQIVYSVRKRRLIRNFYEKANALRIHMMEHHHHPQENKSTTDLDNPTYALEYLIYNLNRNALSNFDERYMPTPDTNDLVNRSKFDNHLKIPSRLKKQSIKPLFGRHRSLITTNNKNSDAEEDIFDESDFDTRPYEEQSSSVKSLSHILEENKPWMAKLTDDGSIQHVVLSPKHTQNTRLESL